MQTQVILVPLRTYYQLRCFQNVCCSLLSHAVGEKLLESILFVYSDVSAAAGIMPGTKLSGNYLLRK